MIVFFLFLFIFIFDLFSVLNNIGYVVIVCLSKEVFFRFDSFVVNIRVFRVFFGRVIG